MEFKDNEDADEVEDSLESNEIEQSKVANMRTTVEAQDPSAKELDNLALRRFLRARDLDVEKASSLLLKCLSWRRSFVPNGSIALSEIQNEIAQNKVFKQGFDMEGHPIVVIYAFRHVQHDVEEFKRFVVYSLEKICASMPRGQEKFVAIADLQGWGYANSDIRGFLAAISILQDCYPERLAKYLVIHAPYIFSTVWKIIRPFIDARTRKKVVFVENNKLRSTLLSYIDESQLPDIYGGKLSLIPIQDT